VVNIATTGRGPHSPGFVSDVRRARQASVRAKPIWRLNSDLTVFESTASAEIIEAPRQGRMPRPQSGHGSPGEGQSMCALGTPRTCSGALDFS